jgi:hypothetical protein
MFGEKLSQFVVATKESSNKSFIELYSISFSLQNKRCFRCSTRHALRKQNFIVLFFRVCKNKKAENLNGGNSSAVILI